MCYSFGMAKPRNPLRQIILILLEGDVDWPTLGRMYLEIGIQKHQLSNSALARLAQVDRGKLLSFRNDGAEARTGLGNPTLEWMDCIREGFNRAADTE